MNASATSAANLSRLEVVPSADRMLVVDIRLESSYCVRVGCGWKECWGSRLRKRTQMHMWR